MDIEEFIDQDIPAFLDKYVESKEESPGMDISSVYITRDYEKELFNALDHNDLVAAKRVLHDLKKKFDECPHGTPDKQQLKLLLTNLYEKFKDHIDSLNTFEKMDDELHRLEKTPERVLATPQKQQPIPQTAPSKPHPQRPKQHTTLSPQPKPVRHTAPKPIVKPRKLPPEPEPDPHVVHLLDRTATHLEKDNVLLAQQLYREARTALLALHNPSPVLTARTKLIFQDINAHKQALQKQQTEKTVQHMHAILDEVEQLLHTGAVQQAATRYRDARTAILKLTNTPPALTHRVTQLFTTIKQQMHPAAHMDKQLLLRMEQEKRQLDTQLKAHNISEAMRTYKRIRLLAQQVTNKKLANTIAQKLRRMHTIIDHIRQSNTLQAIP